MCEEADGTDTWGRVLSDEDAPEKGGEREDYKNSERSGGRRR